MKLCSECLARGAAVPLEEYHVPAESDILGGVYRAIDGWICPQCRNITESFPFGCAAVVVLLLVLIVAALL